MKVYRFVITAAFVFTSFYLRAGDLKPPVDFPSAKTLPKGVRNFRFKEAWVQGTQMYDNSGSKVSLGNKIDSAITVEKIIDGESDPDKQSQLAGYLHGSGYEDSDELGQVSGEVNVAANVYAPILAYGFTNRLTVALAVPIIQSKTSVDTGYISNEAIYTLKQKLERQGNGQDSEELVRNMNRPVDKKIEDYGYNPLVDESKTEMGDIKLVSKYKLKEQDVYTLSLLGEMTLPTGKEVSIDKAFGVPSGDGQTDVGLGLAFDYDLTDKLNFSKSVGFIVQLPDKTDKRIPRRADTALSPDKEENIDRNLGDLLYANLATTYNIFYGFYAKGGYSFQYKGRDSYAGNKYQDYRYNWMEVNTEQNMHSLIGGLSFSSVQLYQQKRAILPLEANVTYSTVLTGKNVVSDSLIAFEAVLYF
ncbi:MAG: hypothetical protein A2381_16175 [Bdellovibrionales bacterium RIFOXYB1_FULL_37_110]|nr:MAG: hypothetical protein A2417_08025 [Bdellovibrionales bacterium RIFOXYC1_FULL_37_79]OFZ57150.1 MAG: hypothetical protein A2381_16175 [Bdellovibrionales bacterium RIFOXYB1_FULL_37_110]OFZ65366.1 MAG: hypothetical protein A2577_03695 [Bdellovibrionales bacterium RIFOXYD1_FULL_36_51]